MSKNSIEVEVAVLETKFESVEKKLGEILIQTKKTNGRVTVLEKISERTKGALWVMGVVFTVLMAVPKLLEIIIAIAKA